MAHRESQLDFDSHSNSNLVRSNPSKRKKIQHETQFDASNSSNHPSTSKNSLANPPQPFIKRPSDPNKWTSVAPSLGRDKDRVGSSRDERNVGRTNSGYPQQTLDGQDGGTNSRIGWTTAFHSTSQFEPPPPNHFSSSRARGVNTSRSHKMGDEPLDRSDARFKPPPPMTQVMAPPYSRAPSISRPESAIATPPPSNIGSSPYQTKPPQFIGHPTSHYGPPITLAERGRSSSSVSQSNYPPSNAPPWNHQGLTSNQPVYPLPPPSVSSSSNRSYRQPSSTPFSSRFHPAHPLARSSSIQPGIGSPFGPPAYGGGLPFAASLGGGMGFNRSASLRSGSIAPSNHSRNTTNSSFRNKKSLPKSDWNTLMGMIQNSKNDEKEKALEKEREKVRERQKELRLESLNGEKDGEVLDQNPQDQPSESIGESIENVSVGTQKNQTIDSVQLEKIGEEKGRSLRENSKLPPTAKRVVQDESIEETTVIPVRAQARTSDSSEEATLVETGSSEIPNISKIFQGDPNSQTSTSQLPIESIKESDCSETIMIPSLSSWYLARAPVGSLPIEILKSHPHASDLKSWIHLQGFRIGGEKHGEVWKSSAIISRVSLDDRFSSNPNQVHSSEALDGLGSSENEEPEDARKELKSLVSRLSTASGKIYEIRGKPSEKEMMKKGFKNLLGVIQDHTSHIDLDSLHEGEMRQVWPEDEIWIDAVIKDLKVMERKANKRIAARQRKGEEMIIKGEKVEDEKVEEEKVQAEEVEQEEVQQEEVEQEEVQQEEVEQEEVEQEEVEQEKIADHLIQEADTSGVLHANSPQSLKRKRKPSAKAEANHRVIEELDSKGRSSNRSASENREKATLVANRKARRSSPSEALPKKRKKRKLEVFEHGFELIIPPYERKSSKSISKETDASDTQTFGGTEADAIETEETNNSVEEEIDGAEAEGSEAGEKERESDLERESEEDAIEMEKEVDVQHKGEDSLLPETEPRSSQVVQTAPQEAKASDSDKVDGPQEVSSEPLQLQVDKMELEPQLTHESDSDLVEMPALDDRPEIEDDAIEAREMQARGAADEPIGTFEHLEVEEAPVQASSEDMSKEKTDASPSRKNQEYQQKKPNRKEQVDPDEFENPPEPLVSTSNHAGSSKSSKRFDSEHEEGNPSTSVSKATGSKSTRQSDHVDTTLKPGTSKSFKARKPRSSAPAASVSKMTGQKNVSRELASLMRSPFGTFNFLQSVELVVKPAEGVEEVGGDNDDDDELNEIRKLEKEIMESSQEKHSFSSKVKSKSNSSTRRGTGPKKARKSLPVTSKEIRLVDSDSSSRSNSFEPSTNPSPASFRSSTRTRVTTKPKEWWKVSEDTFRSPRARSNGPSSLSKSSSKGISLARTREVVESDGSEDEGESEIESGSEDSSTEKNPRSKKNLKSIKRSKPLRLATESPSSPDVEERSKGKDFSNRKDKSERKSSGSTSLSYGRRGSRSPIKKAGSRSFPIEDAYVFSD